MFVKNHAIKQLCMLKLMLYLAMMQYEGGLFSVKPTILVIDSEVQNTTSSGAGIEEKLFTHSLILAYQVVISRMLHAVKPIKMNRLLKLLFVALALQQAQSSPQITVVLRSGESSLFYHI